MNKDKLNMYNKEEHLLSIVLCGRNDNYLGDFKYRITTSINYLCRNAEKIGRLKDIEVIVVDWNSETPLSAALYLVPEALETIKFIIVPPDIAKKYLTNRQVFNVGCAINVGIRRANGTYIMPMTADTLITSTSLQNLLLLLEEKLDPVFDPKKTMLNIGRKEVPWQIVKRKPNLKEWDRYLQLHCRKLLYEKTWHGISGGYGAILMHKLLWHQCQGFLEHFGWYGWIDADIGLRINQLYPYIDLICFGIFVFDMQGRQREKIEKQSIRHRILPKNIDSNQEDWGLRTNIFEVTKGEPCKINTDHVNKNSINLVLSRNRIINELKSTIVPRNLRGIDGTIPKGNDWACLFPLIWFSSKFSPSKYLEIGTTKGCTIFVVSSLIETIEIYMMNVDDFAEMGTHFLSSINNIFISVGYRGYNHFIIGDKHTGLIRLNQAFIGPMSFDLILFRVDLFKDKAPEYLREIMEFLEYNGGLIVTGHDKKLFNNVLEFIQKEFSKYICIICKTYNTAFILKNKLDSEELPDSEHEEKIFSKAWKPPKFRMYLIATLSKFYSKCAKVYNKSYLLLKKLLVS